MPKLAVAFFIQALAWHQLYHGQRRPAWLCPHARWYHLQGRLRQ